MDFFKREVENSASLVLIPCLITLFCTCKRLFLWHFTCVCSGKRLNSLLCFPHQVLDSRFVDFGLVLVLFFFDSRLFLKLIKINKILKVQVSQSSRSWKRF